MSEVRVNNLSNENNTGGPTISGITTYSSTDFFVPPQGDTASRPQDCPSGSLRFNTDTARLEYYRGDGIGWSELEAGNEELGGRTESGFSGTSSNREALGHRLLLAGGRISAPAFTDTIEYLTISTLGNTDDFGNLVSSHGNPNSQGGASSRTRGIWLGGQLGSSPNYSNVIQAIEIASLGNAFDFGDINGNIIGGGNVSNQIRALHYGGSDPSGNKPVQIDAVTIASAGNARDFGDMAFHVNNTANFASTTRGFLAGGSINPVPRIDITQYITIMTEGTTTFFGDLTAVGDGVGRGVYNAIGYSNATRGIIHGGRDVNSNHKNCLQYITMSTTGNSVEFGDVNVHAAHQMGGSSPTRGVVGAGFNPSNTNAMEFVNIVSLGNAVDFGDCTGRDEVLGGCSNGHGGLS